jgi:8-amino-7-oxononanoate synthase
MDARSAISADLDFLASCDLHRSRRIVLGRQGPEVEIDGRRVLCFASNDYLGLAGDDRLVRASIAALERAGAGAAASPLISGHMEPHDQLERELAEWMGSEAAILFGSGYHANIGTIAALVGPEDEIFSDALNHASLIDGCRLARARVSIYPHRDTRALGRALEASRARRRLVVTDSVFSMDGDVAPLAEIVALAERARAWVMVDEAHATGVFGPEGAGLAAALGLGERITVRMGTLGKALGGYGAFVAGSRALIDWLVNRARAYVYSTALPPAVVGAVRAAVVIARTEETRRERLWQNARRLHAGLAAAGCEPAPLESPIVPLVLGGSRTALEVARRTLAAGVLAPAIRPPTVPEGTARLRLTPIATHRAEQIDRAVDVLAGAVAEVRS